MTDTPSEADATVHELLQHQQGAPYAVLDHDGDAVAEGLDNVPPLLNQEEIDRLYSHLEDTLITEVAIADVMVKLPDSEAGAGDIIETLPIGCRKCGERIEQLETNGGQSFGYFHHVECPNDV